MEENRNKDIRRVIDLINGTLLRVEHMEGSSKYEPKDGGTWKDYWEKKKSPLTFPTKTTKCECCGEDTAPQDFVGAHIQEVNNKDKRYIYPLCATCNDTYGKGKEKSTTFDVKKEFCVRFLLSEAKIVHPDK